MARDTAVILITWNAERYLPRCISGIHGQTLKPRTFVVVDNASSDGTREAIRRVAPEARLVENRSNLGFAAAANQGIRATDEEWVLFLNPDVFLSPEYLERAVGALSDAGEDFGAATGKLLRGVGAAIDPTRVVDSRGIRMTRTGRHLDIDAGSDDDGSGGRNTEVFGVSGAAAVYRRSCLADLAVDGEFFDEDFFTYREDADLAWRARLRSWRSLYVPQAVAWHVRRVTPERRSELPAEINLHSVKNRFLLRWKNAGSYLLRRDMWFLLARDLVVLAATLTAERSSLGAWAWLWRNRKKIAEKRRLIQGRRIVSDREIARWFE